VRRSPGTDAAFSAAYPTWSLFRSCLIDYDAHLDTVPAAALCGGLGAYVLAHVLLRYRISRTIGRGRPVALVALIAMWPFADDIPALAALGTTAAVFVLLIAYEAIRYREPRAQLRHGALATEEMMSAPARRS
jgi:hypothetical protein